MRTSAKPPVYKVPVLFKCGHTNYYVRPNPRVGEEAYCRQCQDWCEVVKATSPFRLKCQDCSFGRTFGADGVTARRKAIFHLHNRPQHAVDIYEGAKLVETVQGVQATFGEELREAAKHNQAMLRDFLDKSA